MMNVKFLIKVIIFIVICIFAFFYSGKAFTGTDGLAGSIMSLMFGIVIAFFAALFFIRAFLPTLAEKFAFGLIFPRHFIKNPRPALSPINAKIALGEYDEAEVQLLEVIAKFPDYSEAVEILVNLYADTARGDKAVDVAKKYLLLPQKEQSKSNMKILLRMADIMRADNRIPEMNTILEKALKEDCFSSYDKSMISARLALSSKN